LRSAVVLGSRSAIEELAAQHRPRGKVSSVPQYRRLARPEVDADKAMKKLAAAFGVEKDALFSRRRNFLPRQAVYYHLVETLGLPVSQVADLMEVTTGAVSQGTRKFAARLASDKSLARLMTGLTIN